MRKQTLKTGIGLLLLAASAGAVSQDSAVEVCRKTASDAERIDCLEKALARNSHSAPGIEERTSAARQNETTGDPASARESGHSRNREDEAQDIGARQVKARGQTRAELEASLESATGLRVAGYAQVPYRRLEVELENGQVWRQIAGDTQHLRVTLERNQTVDIQESRISGYKLRLNELGRTIRVERIR